MEALPPSPAAGPSPDVHAPGRRSRPAGSWRSVASWLPVLSVLVLFAQVAILGLRPALCERRRLIEAEAVLSRRCARDLDLRARMAVNLEARDDPVFLERQRRLRLHGVEPRD